MGLGLLRVPCMVLVIFLASTVIDYCFFYCNFFTIDISFLSSSCRLKFSSMRMSKSSSIFVLDLPPADISLSFFS